jgi:hypothetical protein
MERGREGERVCKRENKEGERRGRGEGEKMDGRRKELGKEKWAGARWHQEAGRSIWSRHFPLGMTTRGCNCHDWLQSAC